MIAPNVNLTTASTTLFTLLPSTRALVLTNSTTSAGNATFTVRGDQTAGFADQTLSTWTFRWYQEKTGEIPSRTIR